MSESMDPDQEDVENPAAFAKVCGLWLVVSGQWSVVNGQWSVVGGQGLVVSGQWVVISIRPWRKT